MIIKKLAMTNFLCYFGENEIEFGLPGKKHLTFIRGNNRGGKTSLLRAINWVLYDKDTLNKCKENLDWLTYEAAKNDDFSFSVALSALKEDKSFELTRKVSLKPGIIKPESDEDFISEFFILEEGVAKSGDEQKRTVNYLLDEEVSDLFLFDGEKLQDYKDLLEGKGKSNLLKKKIERVMRKPQLVSTKQDIDQFYSEYQAKVVDENQEEAYNDLLADIKSLTNLKYDKEKNIKELNSLVEAQDTLISDINKALEADADKTEAAAKLNLLTGKLEEIEKNLSTKKDELKNQSEHIYKMLINKSGIEISSESNIQRQILLDRLKRPCPICGKSLTASQKEEIQKELDEIDQNSSIIRSNGNNSGEEIPTLNEIKALTEEVDSLSYDFLEKTIQRENLLSEATSEDGENYKEKASKLLLANNEKSRLEGLIKDDEMELKGPEAKGIKDLYYDAGIEAALQTKENLQVEFANNNEFAKKAAKITKLRSCVEKIIEGYMEDMKLEIEKSANEFNNSMTVGDADQSLVINDNFGLQLRNAANRNTSTSSSGDQIIAMSLLFALRKATKMQGPFLIDTPFGRVDFDQEETITDSLIEQSDQLILLCQPKEISQNGKVFKKISSKIGKNYRIESKNQYLSSIKSS